MKKKLKITISLLLALLTVSGSPMQAYAEPDATDTPPAQETEYTLDGKTWDELLEEFTAKYNCGERTIAAGYRNTVTGEEHFYRGGEYMEGGSLYKVPLTMAYAEKIAAGELTEESTVRGYNLGVLMRGAVVNSNNEYATALWNGLGTFYEFKAAIAPYMGVDPDNVDQLYYHNRFFTPEQIIHCLDELHANPDKYPGIEDLMKEAEPEKYFNGTEQPVPIAHKYGYIDENGFFLNDSAICYTDDPICIVLFTANMQSPYDALPEFCTLMCEYAQASREQRLAEEERKAEEERLAEEKRLEEERLEAERKAEEMAAEKAAREAEAAEARARAEAEELAAQTERAEKAKKLLPLTFAVGGIGAVAIIVLALRKKLRLIPALLSIVLFTLALSTCVLAASKGTLVTRTEGDPMDSIRGFFDDIVGGSYEEACFYLKDYSDLGLNGGEAAGPQGKILDALRNSYAYTFNGDCRRSDLSAVQEIRFSYLDVSSLTEDLKAEVNRLVAERVDTLPKNEVYGENDSYLPEFTSQAYADAVDSVLATPEKYSTDVLFSVNALYSDGAWKLEIPQELLTALYGGRLS